MKKWHLAIGLSTLLIAVPLTGSVPKPAEEEQREFQLLFIQTAKEVIVKQHPKNPDKWLITLRKLTGDVAYFSEQPKKIAGKISVENFLEEWRTSTQNNPKGILAAQFSHSKQEGDSSKRWVKLSNPRFDSRNNTITYNAQNPPGKNNLSQGEYRDAVLFIKNSAYLP